MTTSETQSARNAFLAQTRAVRPAPRSVSRKPYLAEGARTPTQRTFGTLYTSRIAPKFLERKSQ